jgi:hypothetical protein
MGPGADRLAEVEPIDQVLPPWQAMCRGRPDGVLVFVLRLAGCRSQWERPVRPVWLPFSFSSMIRCRPYPSAPPGATPLCRRREPTACQGITVCGSGLI